MSRPKRVCSVEECDKWRYGKGYCKNNWLRFKTHGNPLAGRILVWHGMARSKEYETWHNIKTRCYSKASPQYKDWGGRGITMCPRWKDSFLGFYEDMGPKPAGMTLDRIDNDGNYEPSNCRWATQTEQILNQRLRSTNKSGYKGVRRDGMRWTASITVNYRSTYLGMFKTAEEAFAAYQAKAKELR